MAIKPKSVDSKEGPPRWTYIAGSIVAMGGLAWGIVSYFIPKPDTTKPPSAPVVTQQAKADGGNAINAAGNAVVEVDNHSSQTLPSAAPQLAPNAVNQSATAANGGTSVNASDSARVKVNK
jgi:hypothetical protein